MVGFDMVNEEDSTPPIKEFTNDLFKAKQEFDDTLPFFFHGKFSLDNFANSWGKH